MRNEMEKTVMTLHCSFAGLQQSGSCGKQSSMLRYLTLRVFLSSSCPNFSLPCGNIDLVLCECGLVAYTVGSRRMVTLKRHIVIKD
ncbi:hypothetical protein MHYP_G00174120 [Metynnis hypsauchen]